MAAVDLEGHMRNVWLTAVAFFIVPLGGFCAQNPPSKMIHMIVQVSGSEIPEGAFAGKLKTMWRASNSYCRIDEEPDPEQGLHIRLIMNEPNAWLVDLAHNRAKHMVDPGPTFNCRMPIFVFDSPKVKGKIGELEFGHELEFFQKNGAKQIEGPQLEFNAKFYELAIDSVVLRLVERVDIHAPYLVGLIQGEMITRVRYLLWDEVPFKADLFAKPTGVKIEETAKRSR
jgi:hypothetical protein